MTQPTPTIAAILAGLKRGGQSGLAEIIEAEIEKLEPLSGDRRRLKRDPEEDRRQAVTADQVVTSLIKAEILEREELRELIGQFDIEQVETITELGPDEGGRTVDVLTDPDRIESLKTFLDAWRTQIEPLFESGSYKQ